MDDNKADMMKTILDALRGCDIMISGTTLDGTSFQNRFLRNISVTECQKGQILIAGGDPSACHAGPEDRSWDVLVRSFRLDRLTNIRIVSGPMTGAQVSRRDAGGPWSPGGVGQSRPEDEGHRGL